MQEINANNEITANFVGEVLFGGENELIAFVETLTTKQRKGILGFLQRVYEYVRDKITKYKYSKTNQFLKNLDKELADLHRQFAMLYQSAENTEQQKNHQYRG